MPGRCRRQLTGGLQLEPGVVRAGGLTAALVSLFWSAY
jgi:hypothetical protein